MLTRTEIYDSEEQLVSHFIGGLCPQLQTALAQFDPANPATIAEAHRRAATFEQQQQRSSSWTGQSARSRPTEQTNAPAAAKESDTQPQGKRQTDDQYLRRSTRPPALKCYTCGERVIAIRLALTKIVVG